MSTITMEEVTRRSELAERASMRRTVSDRGVRPARPDRGSARRSGPNSRGRSGVAAPQLTSLGSTAGRACAGETAQLQLVRPVPVAPSRLRITERGIAVVLVAGAMIVVAALTVVGATAYRVTSDHYQPAMSLAAR